MVNVATAINTFAQKGQQDTVQPSEEPIFVLTYSQLQELVKEVQGLKESLLEAQKRLDLHEDKMIILQNENDALKRELEAFQDITGREIALDRQRISKLEHVEPQPMQRDRAEILKALMAANGGKMLAKDARSKMRISKAAFSLLLTTLKDEIGSKPYHLDKRQSVIFIKEGKLV